MGSGLEWKWNEQRNTKYNKTGGFGKSFCAPLHPSAFQCYSCRLPMWTRMKKRFRLSICALFHLDSCSSVECRERALMRWGKKREKEFYRIFEMKFWCSRIFFSENEGGGGARLSRHEGIPYLMLEMKWRKWSRNQNKKISVLYLRLHVISHPFLVHSPPNTQSARVQQCLAWWEEMKQSEEIKKWRNEILHRLTHTMARIIR